MHAKYQGILWCSEFVRAVWFIKITTSVQKHELKIGQYYVSDIKITYRRVHTSRFKRIHQELSEIQHFKDVVWKGGVGTSVKSKDCIMTLYVSWDHLRSPETAWGCYRSLENAWSFFSISDKLFKVASSYIMGCQDSLSDLKEHQEN